MKILICATDGQYGEILEGCPSDQIQFFRINAPADFDFSQPVDASFFLNNRAEELLSIGLPSIPVFINEVVRTNSEMNLPENFLRINGWNGFLRRKVWEVAGKKTESVVKIAISLGRELVFVDDVPGLVAATVVCNIINEAFIAFEEGVSSKEEINSAMKLGTNYPYGPFEWGNKIGIENVNRLLGRLAEDRKRKNEND
ncbi:MAG: hypothetical protein J5I50_12045 [Chitinophagaceae bacterium]|nr:hypothetical protein [Chitinophagaceae bacterium]